MSELDTFNVRPRGDVTHSFAWNSTEVKYWNGRVQHNRKRVKPLHTMSFTVSGLSEDLEYVSNFYDAHHGCLDPFYFVYDGKKETCYFSEKVTVRQNRELNKIIGYEMSVSLRIDHSTYDAQDIPEKPRFNFPILGKIEDSSDWNTNLLDMLVVGREKTYDIPVHEFSFNLSGLKEERDKLISSYVSLGDFTKFRFDNKGMIYYVYYPSELQIVDKRELQNIIGYTCRMTLTSTNSLVDYLGLKGARVFLVGKGSSLKLSQYTTMFVGTLLDKFKAWNFKVQFVGHRKDMGKLRDTHCFYVGREMPKGES